MLIGVLAILMIEIMCLATIQDQSSVNQIGTRISTRTDENKSRGRVNQSNLILISPIQSVSNERSRNGTKQNNSKCFDRKQYQNHANLVHIKTERDGKSNSNLKFCLLNAQSVKNKYQTINEYILDEKIDICSITETWLHSNDTQVSNDLCPDGFEIIQKSRDSKQNNFVIKQRGGGVAVVCRQSFNAKLIKSKKD